MTANGSGGRKPRLAVIGKVSFRRPFGANQGDYATYQALLDYCERIDIIAVSDSPQEYCETDGALHIHCGPKLPGFAGHVAFWSYATSKVRELEATARPDVYWCSDPLDSSLVGWYAHRLGGAPWVVHIQGNMFEVSRTRFSAPERWLIRRLTVEAARRATRVRTVARVIADELLRVGIPPDRVVNLPMRTDMRRFDRSAYGRARTTLRAAGGWDDACILTFVGSLNDSKGIDLLFEAAARVRDEFASLRVVLVGDGPLWDELHAMADRLGLTELVRFVGRVPYQAVPEHLAAADALVLCSRDEGLPRCAIEGAAMELPLLLTNVGGMPELVVDGESGWLVAPTVEGVAAGLRALGALSPSERAAVGARGRRHVSARFDFDTNIKHMANELVLRVVADHGW